MYLTSPVITMPTGTTASRLAFEHYVATEAGWDGGNLKVSVNGGPWTLVEADDYDFNAYNTTLNTVAGENTNPLAGEDGFSGTDGGQVTGSWGQSLVDLRGYDYVGPGDTIQLRFELGTDGCAGIDGWYVDNVEVYYCDSESNAQAAVNVTELEATQSAGYVTTQTITLSNNGTTSMTWSVVEEDTTRPVNPLFAQQVMQAVRQPLFSDGGPAAPDAPLADVIQDGSFEAGTPNPYWTEFSAVFGTPLCNPVFCGPFARTGDWYVWFGGTLSAEQGSVDQDVTIEHGTATLDFYLFIDAGTGATGNFTVTVDSTVLFTATEVNTATYGTDYTLVTLDVSAFADGGVHNVMFAQSNPALPGPFGVSFLVDDVSLDNVPGCLPSDIPWLTVTPASGTLQAGDSQALSVVFNSTGLVNGTYTGQVCVNSNDTDNPSLAVPVTLEVRQLHLPIITK
jgi:hypothetical protein